jgi:hypothetical protein
MEVIIQAVRINRQLLLSAAHLTIMHEIVAYPCVVASTLISAHQLGSESFLELH